MFEDFRYEYDYNGNKYYSNEIEEYQIVGMLNSRDFFCIEVIVKDRQENKTYKYSMLRKLIKEEVK